VPRRLPLGLLKCDSLTVGSERPVHRWRAQAEQLALLDHAERMGLAGSWEWTPSTGELLWSANYFRLFGLEPGSITPSAEFLLAHVHPKDRERVEAALADVAGGAAFDTLDYRIVRDDDVVCHLRATVAFVDEGEDGPRRLVGSVQDVTDQDSLARKLGAHAAVSKALDEWEEFEHGAQALLEGIATAMNLPFGALWIPQREALTAKVVWHLEDMWLTILADATRDWYPGPGGPTLGRAWASRQPVASNEPAVGGPPQRRDALRAAGIRASIVIPAVAADETLAVLEFFSLEPIEPTDRLLRALNGIGHEVGYFLARHRGELVDPVLTPREVQVLQLAARALTAAAIAQEMQISPATVKRHFEDAYARLGVSDRAAAVAQAMRQGLIT
jgi:DNA-binding CsgD family transcriptional regulator